MPKFQNVWLTDRLTEEGPFLHALIKSREVILYYMPLLYLSLKNQQNVFVWFDNKGRYFALILTSIVSTATPPPPQYPSPPPPVYLLLNIIFKIWKIADNSQITVFTGNCSPKHTYQGVTHGKLCTHFRKLHYHFIIIAYFRNSKYFQCPLALLTPH